MIQIFNVSSNKIKLNYHNLQVWEKLRRSSQKSKNFSRVWNCLRCCSLKWTYHLITISLCSAFLPSYLVHLLSLKVLSNFCSNCLQPINCLLAWTIWFIVIWEKYYLVKFSFTILTSTIRMDSQMIFYRVV